MHETHGEWGQIKSYMQGIQWNPVRKTRKTDKYMVAKIWSEPESTPKRIRNLENKGEKHKQNKEIFPVKNISRARGSRLLRSRSRRHFAETINMTLPKNVFNVYLSLLKQKDAWLYLLWTKFHVVNQNQGMLFFVLSSMV